MYCIGYTATDLNNFRGTLTPEEAAKVVAQAAIEQEGKTAAVCIRLKMYGKPVMTRLAVFQQGRTPSVVKEFEVAIMVVPRTTTRG